MTNRVLPAQGEERGASLTLTRIRWGCPAKVPVASYGNYSSGAPVLPGNRINETGKSRLKIRDTADFTFRDFLRPGPLPQALMRLIPVSADAYIDLAAARRVRRPAPCAPAARRTMLSTASSATSSTSSSCTCMMSRAGTCELSQPGVDLDHGALDDVGGGALHGCVDGAAFRVLAQRRRCASGSPADRAVGRIPFRRSRLARLMARLVHVALHARVALEIQVHVALRFAAADARADGRGRRPTCRRSNRS